MLCWELTKHNGMAWPCFSCRSKLLHRIGSSDFGASEVPGCNLKRWTEPSPELQVQTKRPLRANCDSGTWHMSRRDINPLKCLSRCLWSCPLFAPLTPSLAYTSATSLETLQLNPPRLPVSPPMTCLAHAPPRQPRAPQGYLKGSGKTSCKVDGETPTPAASLGRVLSWTWIC